MIYKFFDKETTGSGIKSIPQNEQLAEELHKPIIRKFKKRKVYSAFKNNVWDADLADMQLISKFNKGFRILLCVIDIFSKHAWVVPWTYIISDLNGEEIIGIFFEKELQKTNQEEFRIEKVTKKKENKLYVKWKGYDNSFNSWIDKKDLVK